MSKNTFTPGPWVLSPISQDLIGTLHPGGKLIAQIHGANRDANAALIMAAPDLLAALIGLSGCHDSGYALCDCASCKAAAAAITKATTIL